VVLADMSTCTFTQPPSRISAQAGRQQTFTGDTPVMCGVKVGGGLSVTGRGISSAHLLPTAAATTLTTRAMGDSVGATCLQHKARDAAQHSTAQHSMPFRHNRCRYCHMVQAEDMNMS
jgi:hypothetical protein